MSKKDKLIKQLQNNPKDIRFETLKNLLVSVGYVALNNGSSHWQFRKDDEDTLTIPYKRPIKPCYIKMVLKALEKKD